MKKNIIKKKKMQKKYAILSILGDKSLTGSLQSIPFQNPWGVAQAFRTEGGGQKFVCLI